MWGHSGLHRQVGFLQAAAKFAANSVIVTALFVVLPVPTFCDDRSA
jgi:hypothetical protein